jgi:DNA-binding beta-propeller fold protein YncE
MRTTAFLVLATALVGALLAGCAEAPQRREPTRDLVFPSPPDEPKFVFERSIYSSRDVLAREKDAGLRQVLTGEAERGGEGLQKPYAIAVREGRLYVSDPVAGTVKLFDIPARKFLAIGPDPQEQLVQPLGIDVDAQFNLYVVDGATKDVKIYDQQGKFLRRIGGPKVFSRPSGIAAAPDGTRLYVVDTGGVSRQEEHRVRVYDPATGAHLFDFGKRGTGNGEFNLPRDITVAPDGALYVVDSGNFRVQAFDRDGKFLRSFGAIGRQFGNFARPREVAVDRQGTIYVSDAAFGNMQLFNSAGELLMFIGARSERDEPARYTLLSGVGVDLDGRVYVADEFFRRVDVFRPALLKAKDGFVAAADAVAPPAPAAASASTPAGGKRP